MYVISLLSSSKGKKRKRTYYLLSLSIFYLAILRHSSAHLRHACAHNLQCSICWCFSHSSAHASQNSAHVLQICFTNSLSLDINWEAVQQTEAQSRSNWMHRSNIFTSCSLRQEVAHSSHDSAQALQASMQVWYLEFCSVFVDIYYLPSVKIFNTWTLQL